MNVQSVYEGAHSYGQLSIYTSTGEKVLTFSNLFDGIKEATKFQKTELFKAVFNSLKNLKP